MGQGGRPYVRRGANVSAWSALVQMYLCEYWWARKVRDKFCLRRRSQSLVGRHYKVLTLQILVRPRAYSTGQSFSPLFVC